MNADRWKQIDEIVDAALDLPEQLREQFVRKNVDGDEKLALQILKLLKAHKESESFMQDSAMDWMGKTIAENKAVLFENSLINRKIGNYRIEKMIGSGGMGEVYLAHDEKLDRKVALKILAKEFYSNAERVKRFKQEARAITVLNHPNIVTIYDFDSDQDIHYIATEYVEGETVRELIGSDLPLKNILNIILQAVEALAAAHNAGITHRDIKPENMIVRPDGYLKILDFGLAKLAENEQINSESLAKTGKGMVIGTPAYMSPAQASGEKLDHRTDLWSIGVVLYELLTGRNPFKKENRQATMHSILAEQPPSVSSANAEISPEFDRILNKALEKDPDLGYQTAPDLQADLKRIRREIDSTASFRSGSDLSKSGGFVSAANSRRFWGSGLTALLIIVFGFWYFFYHRQVTGPDWMEAKNVRLSEQAGTEFYPSLSPDGKRFVYSAEKDGKLSIFSQRVGGKNAENLTENSKADDSQPVFSPDGEFIAFRSQREPNGIYVMGASGENPRRIADFGFHPAWSPDGKQIAVSTNGQDQPTNRNPSAIWIIGVESGQNRLLVDNYALQPSWSPNGKFIAYWFTESGGSRSISVVPADGGEPSVITDEGTTNWNPVWSPDGNFLYFISDRSGSMAVWRQRIDPDSGKVSAKAEVVPTPAKYNRHLSFSADGKRLIYVQTNNKVNLKAAEFDLKSEKVTGEPYWVTNGDREIYLHELSPDGTTFVMRNVTPTQEDLIIIKRDGTNECQLTNDAFFDRYARWSPDGEKIIFTSDRTGNYELWMMNPDGTGLKQITFEKENAASIPAWSPDGRLISFDNNIDSFILDLSQDWNGDALQKLPKISESSFFRAWDWSPDGKKITGYFNKGREKGMAVYFPETGKYEKINDITVFNFWLPDSRRIIYAYEGKAFIADTLTRRTREIESLSKEKIRHIRISRKGDLVSYTVEESESDIWLLDLSQD